MFGKPVIKDTRITVEHILRKLADGLTIQEILKDHPQTTSDDILAAQEFAADYQQRKRSVLARLRNWNSLQRPVGYTRFRTAGERSIESAHTSLPERK